MCLICIIPQRPVPRSTVQTETLRRFQLLIESLFEFEKAEVELSYSDAQGSLCEPPVMTWRWVIIARLDTTKKNQPSAFFNSEMLPSILKVY